MYSRIPKLKEIDDPVSINNIHEQKNEFDVDLRQLKKTKETMHKENRKGKESTRDQRRSTELASLKAASS